MGTMIDPFRYWEYLSLFQAQLIKVKVKFNLEHTRGRADVQLYSFFKTSALDGGGRSTPCPGHFTPWRETQYPLDRGLGGPHSKSGQVWKISAPP